MGLPDSVFWVPMGFASGLPLLVTVARLRLLGTYGLRLRLLGTYGLCLWITSSGYRCPPPSSGYLWVLPLDYLFWLPLPASVFWVPMGFASGLPLLVTVARLRLLGTYGCCLWITSSGYRCPPPSSGYLWVLPLDYLFWLPLPASVFW